MTAKLISVIHPTRRLPLALKVKESWLAAAQNKDIIEYFIVCDQETHPTQDPVEMEADRVNLGIYYSPGNTSVKANNYGASKSSGDIIMMLQDDMTQDVKQGWDTDLIGRLPADWKTKELAIWVGCGLHNPDGSSLCGHIVMTRPHYSRLGYFIPPWYYHLEADLHFSYLSQKQKTALDLRRELVWKHEHHRPDVDPAPYGRVYNSVNDSGETWQKHDYRTFWDYAKPHIDATGTDLPLDFKLP